MSSHKSEVRNEAWSELLKVAKPDSRFHYNFAEFIADFDGSDRATAMFLEHSVFKSADPIFITPDNCLEELRYETLLAGKKILMTTYGIRRGFWLLDPQEIDSKFLMYASTLDGMEKFGKHLSLRDIQESKLQISAMVTGTGAINMEGVRFGKGHGYFDLEWAMLYSVGAIQTTTAAVAFVHECQLLHQDLKPEVFDTVCDLVITNKRIIELALGKAQKPKVGVVWDLLADGMLEDIPPLQELKQMKITI
ncbi:unnamed protein product [Kuraishia capsulata CBS 1993]|uniref:5-formyltetrahydrofolate cyclo-ligase n=1 Tax=Kuraishia capsulata CBS 1993 TaxID=1382522 RepID=W6MFY2_9ASCO|nr:uncharacterized protein KUCA_T00000836001 [Kuraishia capsulata CBS 1993]CDK24869.1 unnamed protein product [Kuraishia capsulata CBS 1993]